jgi:hypothetical protein
MDLTAPLLTPLPSASLKLLGEAEEPLDDEVEDTFALGVAPLVLAGLVAEADLDNSHRMQNQAWENTHDAKVEESGDVVAELVEVTVAPMGNAPLVP